MDSSAHSSSLLCTCAFAALFVALDYALRAVLQRCVTRAHTSSSGSSSSSLQQCATAGRRDVSVQMAIKAVSTLHNIVQIPLALAVLRDPTMSTDRLHATTWRSGLLMLVSSGYFLQDLFNCLKRYDVEGPLLLLHAACCCYAFLYASLSGHLHYYGAAVLMWECSTFNVHLRWLLLKVGRGDSRLFLANGICMMATFFCCRLLWGTYTSLHFCADTLSELARAPGPGVVPPLVIHLFLAANVAMSLLNAWWFWLMLRGAALALQGRRLSDAGQHRSD